MVKKLKYNTLEDVYEGGTPFKINIIKKRSLKKPYKWVTARTPQLTFSDAIKGVDTATGPLLHWIQPSQYVGAVRDAIKGKNPMTSMFRGNSGFFDEEYAKEHPWISSIGNLIGDFGIAAAPKVVNTIKAINEARAVEDLALSTEAIDVAINSAKANIRTKATRTPQITTENAASITPAQWTAAQNAAIARGDMTEAQRLRDLHFKVSAPNSAAVGKEGLPLSLFHGTRTAKGIRENGFSKAMSGKGNRGANEGNVYLTNNYENAEYVGIKAHEIDPIIDKVNSVYDLFNSKTIPSLKQIYSQVDDLSKQSLEINRQLYKLPTGTVWDRISTSLGLKNSHSNKAKKLQSIIDSNNKEIDELNRRAHIVSFLDDGLSFIGGNRDRTVVNSLNFIKEPVNPTSPYRQIAADRAINAMYGTTDQIYSPEVLRLYGNFESPLLSDFKMSPTDINPLKADKWSPIRINYNNKEKALLQELASPRYDSSISKNKFDVLFGDVYIAKNPNNLKSADAVTYDNNGIRIPLGERDNFNINDIRYALLPFLIGGSAYGLSKRSLENNGNK